MPKPFPSAYPKHQRWRFVQRAFKDDEQLISFSEGIVQSNGKDIDKSLPNILKFLKLRSDIKVLKHSWLSLWVNIMHQAGLGYTVTVSKKTRLFATDLGRFVADTHNARAYYYYWALRFQFPFASPKHKYYVDNKVAVQPIVLMCEYLDQLNKIGDGLNDTFLSKYEIAHFLMKSIGHTTAPILDNCARIIKNRKKKYNYKVERRNREFEATADHLFSRGRLFLEKFDLLLFRNDTILISDADTLMKIRSYISYRKPPFLFTDNSKDVRNQFFRQAYCNLDPPPETLLAICTKPSLKPSPEFIETIMKAMMPEATVDFPLRKIVKQVKRAKQKVVTPRQPQVFDIAKELNSISIKQAPNEVKRKGGVLVQPNVKMHAETNLKLCDVDGEKVYLPPDTPVNEAEKHLSAIREFRNILRRVFDAWPCNMLEIAYMSVEPPFRDAHYERNCGIIFNVLAFEQNKSDAFWIWTTARELTYARYGRLNDMTLPFMRDLIVLAFKKAAENKLL